MIANLIVRALYTKAAEVPVEAGIESTARKETGA
jgi:hypothetical protein